VGTRPEYTVPASLEDLLCACLAEQDMPECDDLYGGLLAPWAEEEKDPLDSHHARTLVAGAALPAHLLQ